MKTALIVILGCNILSILYDRINVAINFVNKNYNEPTGLAKILNIYEKKSVHWLLTGGIKSDFIKSQKPEAEVMLEVLKKQNYVGHQFIIDTNSTNTVENFIFLANYLNSTNIYSDVYIVTSDFHSTRAKKITYKISPNNKYKWVLSKEENKDLVFWEKYHINNVDRDIQRAYANRNLTWSEKTRDEL